MLVARRTASVPGSTGRLRECVTMVALTLLSGVGVSTQPPSTVDTSRIGPQIGQTVPAFSGSDQFGRRHTLESSIGPRGAMLVFFRSADW